MTSTDCQHDAPGLLDEVAALRYRVAEQGRASFHRWRPRIERPTFRLGAFNLGHYLAFRRVDLRPLQRKLMPLGLSSLGRAEGRVLAALDALILALSALAKIEAPVGIRRPSPRQFFRGERLLARNCKEIFGSAQSGRAGRILVTLGTDAAYDAQTVGVLAQRGADAFRINCAHDDADRWAKMIAHVRIARLASGRPLPVLMDIGGPKVRTDAVATPVDRDRLHVGDELLLASGEAAGDKLPAFRTGCTLPQVIARLAVGDPVSIDDGKLVGRIVRVGCRAAWWRASTAVRDKGIKLKAEKGLNFPGVDLGLDPSDRERPGRPRFHRQECRHGRLFLRRDARRMSPRCRTSSPHVGPDWRKLTLVAKIETPRAVHNLPEIIVQAAGRQPLAIMIARGDLAIELGFERLAEMQEEILWLCEAAHVPAIWATQVLEGLVTKGRCRRAVR